MDITGTIVSFRGTLEQHYVGAAAKYGVTGVDSTKISHAFGEAYKETCEAYPCFGGAVIAWALGLGLACLAACFHLLGGWTV